MAVGFDGGDGGPGVASLIPRGGVVFFIGVTVHECLGLLRVFFSTVEG